MPDLNRPEEETREKRQFIREKIARPPMTKGQLIKRMLAYLFIAALGGAAAGTSFAIARPLADKYLVTHPTEESIPVTIPTDDPGETHTTETEPQTEESSDEESLEESETENESSAESESSTETESEPESESETESEPETEHLEDRIQSVIESYEYSVKDLDALYGTLRNVVKEANRGIVEVHSVKQEVDWFDNPVETAGLYAGVIVASTGQELLILTPEAAVEQADSIKVTFEDGSEADGIIKQRDSISGMAIVSVITELLPEDTLMEVSVLKLGNSYVMKQGDLVAALGAPAGMVHSSAYGSISYVARNIQVIDGITRLFYADIAGNSQAGTFLVNIDGEIIGWVTDAYDDEAENGLTVAMAISDYKSILERMFNGYSVPYMGIMGQEVSPAMVLDGVPPGVYVTECILDGPAYSAGIQNGDIIVRINDREISTVKEYQNQVEALNQDTVVTVVIQRRGIEEYKELEYQVTIGAR